jgi:hypothetical protein
MKLEGSLPRVMGSNTACMLYSSSYLWQLLANFGEVVRFLDRHQSSGISCVSCSVGAHGSAVGWGTKLQAGRSWVRVPVKSFDFFNWPNPSGCNMALESTQPLREMSTRNLSGGKGRPAHKAASVSRLSRENVEASTSHNPMGLHGLLQA